MDLFREMLEKMNGHKTAMVEEKDAIVGRDQPIKITGISYINDRSLYAPFPDGMEVAYFALGCFWGAEKLFWNIDGVYVTAVGYQGGYTANPTYDEVCSARTGHTEAVMVVFDPAVVSYKELVTKYFESHDPTQFMGQGNDIGTEYRSAIYTTSTQQSETVHEIMNAYNKNLSEKGFGEITTEVRDVSQAPFYYAEEFHQQYLAKNPGGYCNLRGTGVSCAIG